MVCSTKITTLKKSSSSEQYSRQNRLKRKLSPNNIQIISPNQMFITQYFSYIDKISKIVQENDILKKAFFEQDEELRCFKKNIASVPNNIDGFLKRLFKTAILNNAKRNLKNNQCEESSRESFKRFCTYLFIIGKNAFRNFYIFVFLVIYSFFCFK